MTRELLERFKRTGNLPSPPGTVTRMLALCQDEEVPLADLIDTVAADPALSLRLLKYANSSLVGPTEPITTVRDAVLCLGIRSVRLMALSFSVITTREQNHCPGFDYGRFWCHSAACGVAARHLARRTANVSPDEAFTAGLLAHVGKMVFASCRPAEYGEILQLSGGVTGPTGPLEEQHFNTSYADLSAELIEEWGIPQRLAQAVRFHRQPAKLTGDAALERLTTIVGTAALIADILAWADSEENLARHCEALVGPAFFKDVAQAKANVDTIRKEASELASVMSLNRADAPDAGDLQQKANRLRSEMNGAAQLRATAAAAKGSGRDQSKARPLIGTAEREALETELGRRSREAAGAGAPATLVLIDLDQFERILETSNNHTGESAMQAVAMVLQQQLRLADFVARFGRSTFAVLLTGPDHVIAAKICVRIRRSVETLSPSRTNAFPPVTVSIGAVQWMPAEGAPPPETILEAAIQQLARSRTKGCNACSMKLYRLAGSQAIGPGRVGSNTRDQVFIGT